MKNVYVELLTTRNLQIWSAPSVAWVRLRSSARRPWTSWEVLDINSPCIWLNADVSAWGMIQRYWYSTNLRLSLAHNVEIWTVGQELVKNSIEQKQNTCCLLVFHQKNPVFHLSTSTMVLLLIYIYIRIWFQLTSWWESTLWTGCNQ